MIVKGEEQAGQHTLPENQKGLLQRELVLLATTQGEDRRKIHQKPKPSNEKKTDNNLRTKKKKRNKKRKDEQGEALETFSSPIFLPSSGPGTGRLVVSSPGSSAEFRPSNYYYTFPVHCVVVSTL